MFLRGGIRLNKKIFYLLISISVLMILLLIGINIKMNNVKDNTFIAEKLNTNSDAYKKINDKVSSFIKENGVFLLQTEEDNVNYLILDGSHMNLKNESSYFSDVKVENNEDLIMIYYNEELKNYTEGKYPEHRLIYKITKDKETEYIRVFKNKEETHFNSVIGA